MLSRVPHMIVLAASIGPLACASPPDLTEELNAYVTLLNDTNMRVCDCYEDVGFSGYSECLDAMGVVDDGDRACVEAVLEGQEEEGNAFLECANSALSSFDQCLELNGLSCEPDGTTTCQDSYAMDVAACSQLPSASLASIADCTAP